MPTITLYLADADHWQAFSAWHAWGERVHARIVVVKAWHALFTVDPEDSFAGVPLSAYWQSCPDTAWAGVTSPAVELLRLTLLSHVRGGWIMGYAPDQLGWRPQAPTAGGLTY